MVPTFNRHFVKYFLFVAILCLTLYGSATNAQTVIACGGFVKGPETIDFSRIEMRLFTVDGILKYQSFCAPHNGYFTVPVYNHGDYILKLLPPSGWTFSPPQVTLKIDGKADPCSKQEDINFAFIGFQVSGKVVSAGSDVGPEGLRLELQGEKSDDLKTTQTETDGGFSFDGVGPGKYTLVAVHLTWRFRENNIPIVVSKENVVAPTIAITGYDLHGSVISDNNPIAGVTLTLFAPDQNKFEVPECNSDASLKSSLPGFKPVCSVLSDTSGVFSFPPVPPGPYRLVPSYQNGRTRFSVVPSVIDLTISNSSFTIKDSFVVSGFSVSGRLVFPSGYPAKDIVVLIGDKVVAKTGSDGVYVIEKMKTGPINVKFSSEHAEFQPLSVSVSPENAVLNDVSASKLAACGQIIGEAGTDKVDVAAKNTKSGALTIVSVLPRKARNFCFMLEPGDYVFSVESPINKFRPRQLSVALKAGPNFGVSFEAFVATASGKVSCLEKDCTGIFLTLFQNDDDGQAPAPVAEMKTLKAGDFTFRNLHPGQYILKASRAGLCFTPSDGVAFAIEDKDVADLKLAHSGYSIAVSAAHPIRMAFKLLPEEKVSTAVELQPKGKMADSVCLPKPGRYKVVEERFSERENDWACHYFRGSYPTEIDTANLPNEIKPVALLHLVTVGVQTSVQVSLNEIYVGIRWNEDKELYNKLSGKSEDPAITVGIEEELAAYHKQKANRQPIATPLKRRDRLYFNEDQVRRNSNGTYSHNSAIFWYATDIGLEPKHPKLIFKPKMVEFTLDQATVACPVFSAFFTGVQARTLRGSVTPATSGVRVTLTNRNNPEDVHVVWTEQDGTYILGPLDPGDVYDAEASIEGWEILPIDDKPGHFKAKRLGSIDITVVDDSNIPLEGALISISGPSHFRNNSLTDAEGVVALGSLAGGQYYAQAFRKEFSFEPRNLLIPLNSGEAANIKFVGTRVAYSCFGTVVSLNGEPEQSLFVIARSTDCENAPGEEAETDPNGNFRVLGLFPNCTYALTLRHVAQLERTVPTQAIIHVGQTDVYGVKIWAVRAPPPQLLITARLDGPPEFLGMLQVSVMNSTTGSTLSSLTANSLIMAFPPLPVPQSDAGLVVKLEHLASFSAQMHQLKTEAVPVTLDESGFVHVTIKYDVKRRSSVSDQDSPIASLVQGGSFSSFLVAVFVVACVVVVYFWATIDSDTKRSLTDGAQSLFSNPFQFARSYFAKFRASSPTRPRPDKTTVRRSARVRRASSGSTSSSEESSPASDVPTDQPVRKRPLRSRLQ